MPTPAEVVCSRLLRICNQCERENPLPRQFCGDCGALVVALCPRCQFANDFEDRFCGRCALDLESGAETASAGERATSSPATPSPAPPPPVPGRSTRASGGRRRRPSVSVLARRLVALNREKVAPSDAVDLTGEVAEETDEMGQDQIDALFHQ